MSAGKSKRRREAIIRYLDDKRTEQIDRCEVSGVEWRLYRTVRRLAERADRRTGRPDEVSVFWKGTVIDPYLFTDMFPDGDWSTSFMFSLLETKDHPAWPIPVELPLWLAPPQMRIIQQYAEVHDYCNTSIIMNDEVEPYLTGDDRLYAAYVNVTMFAGHLYLYVESDRMTIADFVHRTHSLFRNDLVEHTWIVLHRVGEYVRQRLEELGDGASSPGARYSDCEQAISRAKAEFARRTGDHDRALHDLAVACLTLGEIWGELRFLDDIVRGSSVVESAHEGGKARRSSGPVTDADIRAVAALMRSGMPLRHAAERHAARRKLSVRALEEAYRAARRRMPELPEPRRGRPRVRKTS